MEKKKILLIEDDILTVDVYKTALEFSGFKVDVASFGKEAIKKIESVKNKKNKKPDLIILDFILPDMSGIDVLKKIREREEMKNVPVFVLTNYPNHEIDNTGPSLRVDKFMLKTDYTPRKIVEIVKKRLKK